MQRLTELDLTRAREATPRLEVLPFADSTNAVLASCVSDAAAWPDLSVVVTDDQRAGRGRLDRTWSTPAGGGLAVSVLVRDRAALGDAVTWLPLATGAAVAAAVSSQLRRHRVTIKWPNDVLVDNHKIAGILVQAVGDSVIIGIGINTAMTDFPVETATSFVAHGVDPDLDTLIADVVANVMASVNVLRMGMTGAIADVVRESLGTIGHRVRAHLPDGTEVDGIARDLGADGALVVEVSDGTSHTLRAADIVHLRRY